MTRFFAPNKGKGKCIDFVREALASETEDCILWPYSKNPINGYGMFGHEGKLYGSHRYVCEQAHGPRPTPKHAAAHSCHVRHCVNPRHLSWKTHSENMLDKRDNGTASKAGWGRKGKLTVEEVAKIRSLEGFKTQDAIAKQFNITESNVRFILSRKTWRNVA